jgi:magnesium-protoporphyrin O-methyltransferase
MQAATYQARKGELKTYFDQTAVEAWSHLTSDAPVSRIRATIRAGRDRMRQALLSWLPSDLRGRRVLDAGCGTGALAIECARRGADVVAIDIAPTLINIARERAPTDLGAGSIEFRVVDMTDASVGRVDHVVAMDSLIHYSAKDCVDVLTALAGRTDRSVLFTVAPRTPLLSTMHAVGRLFPRSDRAPSIQPIQVAAVQARLSKDPRFGSWSCERTQRIASGFYISQALELRAA